jgi:hypothetical protein
VHSRASRRASATALSNRFEREGPNSTVNRRSIQATLTETWPDRLGLYERLPEPLATRSPSPDSTRDPGTSCFVGNATAASPERDSSNVLKAVFFKIDRLRELAQREPRYAVFKKARAGVELGLLRRDWSRSSGRGSDRPALS